MRRNLRPSVDDGADANVVPRGDRSDAGDTLIEVLFALMVLGLTSVALLLAFSTSIGASAEHRQLATSNIILQSMSQEAIAGVDSQLGLFACTTDSGSAVTLATFQGDVALTPRPPYTATITQVQWWNGTSFTSTCNTGAPLEITVTVENSAGTLYQNTFVVDFPLTSTNSDAGAAPATNLVFTTQPNDVTTGGAAGEAGAPIVTQPVVEVENNLGQPVSTDYSPVILTLVNNTTGATLSGCSGDEDPNGVVTFSDCTVNLTGTYSLLATDGSLTATSTSFTIGGAGAFLVFTNNSPVAGQSGSAFSTEPQVTVEIASGGTNVVDTGWTGTITITSSGGVLHGNCTGQVTNGVWTAPATSGSGVTACTFEGAYYYNESNGAQDAAPYTLTATGSSSNTPTAIPVVPATSNAFSVTGPGPASKLIFTTQPTGATGTGSTHQFASFAVTLEDDFGNVAFTSSNAVSLSISSGTLNTSCTSGTPVDGVATFSNCYATKTGDGLTITASSGSLTSATSSAFNITGVATQLVFTGQPVAGVSGAAFTSEPQVSVEDASGNLVTASTAAITLTTSGGTLAYCTSLTAVTGVVNVTSCTFAGLVSTSYTMTANSTGLTSAISQSFTPIGPGVATQVVFTTEPVAGAAGSAFTVTPEVKIEDSGGNVVTSSFVNVSFAATGGTFSCPSFTVIAVDGVADLQGCTFGGVVGTQYQLTASSVNLTTGTSADFTPSGPGPAAQVQIVSSSTPTPPPASATTNVSLELQVQDAWGNDTSGTSAIGLSVSSTSTRGFFAATSGGTGTLGAPGIVTIPAGVSSQFLYYGDESAGTPTIAVENVATLSIWGSTSLNIIPAPASQVVLSTTCPSSLASGSACKVAATIEDPFGNIETAGGSGLDFTEGSSDVGSILFSGQTSAGGASTITVTGERAGLVSVNTTAPFVSPSPVSFTVTAGSVSKIVISSGANQTATVNTGFPSPLAALATDTYGNAVPGAVVTFTAPTSGASGTFLAASNGGTCLASGGTSVTSCTATTNASGIASSLSFTANTKSGNYNVAVTSPGTTPNPLNFAETNVPAAPSKVVYSPEPPTTGTAGTALTSFAVSIEDQYGNVETTGTGADDTVTLSVNSGPGTFNSASGTYTNVAAVNGVATFSGVYFDTPGSYTLTATDASRSITTATSTPATAISAGAPSKVVFTTEPPTTGTAGTNLTTFKVSIEDQYGNVETTGTGAGDSVAISSTCSLGGTKTVTASAGVATFNALNVTTAGNCTLVATDASRSITTATSTVIAISAAAPSKVVYSPEPPTTGTAGTALTSFAVSIEDQYGNVETTGTGADDTVTLSVNSGPGTFNSASGTYTNVAAVNGVATFSGVYFDTPGSYTLTATDASRSITTATSTPATAISAGAPSKVVFTTEPPTTGTAGTNLTTFKVSIEDQYGNVETTGTGAGDSVAISSTCSLGGTKTVTASAGVATFNALNVTTAGNCTLVATDASRSITTATSTPATAISAGAPSKVVFTTEPPTTGTAGTALTSFVVSIEDQYGNVETTGTGAGDSVAISSTCSLGGTKTVTASAGVATFNALNVTTAGNCTLVATDASRSITTATSTVIAISAAAPSKVVYSPEPPTTGTAGTALTSFAVSIEDQYGNVETTGTGADDTVTLSVNSGPGTFNSASGTYTNVAAVNGVATFSGVYFDTPGSYTLTATDASRSITTATSTPATAISAGAPSKVVFTTEPPTTGTAGTNLTTFKVSIEDQYGNVETTGTGAGDSVAISSTCSLGGTKTVTASAGVATFNALNVTTAGNCTLVATDASRSITTATSTVIAISAATAADILPWAGAGQSTTVSTAFATPLSALVTDSFGNPIAGATVKFTAPASGASGTFLATANGGTCLASGGTAVPSCTATTNANGIASSLTFKASATMGTYSVAVTSTGTTPNPLNFSETNAVPTLAIISSPQTFTSQFDNGSTTSGSFIVQAQNGLGTPVVLSSPLTVTLTYGAVTGVTFVTPASTGDPGTVTIPAGASAASVTVEVKTSTLGGSFTVTSAATGYASSAAQTETVQLDASSTVTTVGVITGQSVTPGGVATYAVPVTNTTNTNEYYEIVTVNGLVSGESDSTTPTCTTIKKTTTNLAAKISTSTSRPAGTYTLDFVVEQFTTNTCKVRDNYYQGDGALTVSVGTSDISIDSGAGQSALFGSSFASQLTAFVSDAYGNPFVGSTVTFTAPSSGASGTFLADTNGGTCLATGGIAVSSCTATTNASGTASSLTFTANAVAGNYDVTATSGGNAVNFNEANT